MTALERFATSADVAVARQQGAPAVITSNSTPPKIVGYLDEFIPDEAIMRRESLRYANFTGKENATSKAVKAAHQALEQERVLIDISVTLRQRKDQFPRLAVARPSDKAVWCRVYQDNGLVQYRRRFGKMFYEFQDSAYSSSSLNQWVQRMAFTPHLPPELAPHVNPKDKSLIYLWEADWVRESTKPKPIPVRDPALLEHVSGSLYAVVAVWDLSPIEAAALGKPVK